MGFRGEQTPQPIPIESARTESTEDKRPNLYVINGDKEDRVESQGKQARQPNSPDLQVIEGGKGKEIDTSETDTSETDTSETDLLLTGIQDVLRKELAPEIEGRKRITEDLIPEITRAEYEKLKEQFTDVSNNPVARRIHRNKMLGAIFGNQRDIDTLYTEAQNVAEHTGINPAIARSVRKRELAEFEEELKTKPISKDDIILIKHFSSLGHPLAADILKHYETRTSQERIAEIQEELLGPQKNYTDVGREERVAEIKKQADESKLFRAALGDRNLLRDLRQEYLNEFGPEGITKLDDKILDIQSEYRKKEITSADLVFLKSMVTLGSDFAQELLDRYYEQVGTPKPRSAIKTLVGFFNRNKPPQNAPKTTQIGTPKPEPRSAIKTLVGFFTGSKK